MITQLDRLEKTLEVINKKINNLESDKYAIIGEIRNLQHYKGISNREKFINNLIDIHVETVEHKIEQFCGGIGGPQISQFRYEYTLEEKKVLI